MKMKSTHRTLWLWIACFAVLMNALAPSISHAVAYSKGTPPTWEICRADGTRATFTGGVADVAAKKPLVVMAMGEDCAYCAAHAGSFGLPPATVSGLPAAAQTRLHPFLFYRAPQPLAAWSASRPRGPPAQV